MKKIILLIIAVLVLVGGYFAFKLINQDKSKDQANNQEKTMAGINIKDITQATIKTNLGDFAVKFYRADAPKTVANFVKLADEGFYNNTKFHRVIRGFMIQGGDPLSRDESAKERWGTGGPGYAFADEINNHKLVKGSLAMANSGPDTNGSQFFVVVAEETPWLDGVHTNFGEVIEGMELVDKISKVATDGPDLPAAPIVIESIELK